MLHNFVSVYVPGTFGLSGDLDPATKAKVTSETARRLSSAFGGATATNAQGYYVADNGELVVENVTIVKSYHDLDTAGALNIARNIAQWLKDTLQQELVSIETESGLEFV